MDKKILIQNGLQEIVFPYWLHPTDSIAVYCNEDDLSISDKIAFGTMKVYRMGSGEFPPFVDFPNGERLYIEEQKASE